MSTVTIDPPKRVEATVPATKTMKAIIHTKFGKPDVLEFSDVEKPVPDDVRGVLVKIRSSSVNPADYYEMSAPLFMRPMMKTGMRRPRETKLGTDIAGIVEAVSSKVTRFKPGDEVFGMAPWSYAEYVAAREDRLALKPSNSSFEEAGAVGIAGITALQGLRDQGNVQPGQKVLINGAGGGVGTFAVQIAKALGAEVTAVTNSENLDLARRLGADHVIDYAKEDFTKTGEKYDLICDIAAAHSVGDYKRALVPSGTLVIVGMKSVGIKSLFYYLGLGKILPKGGRKLKFYVAKSNQKDIEFLKELMETGKLRPVIDKQYPLTETAEAMRQLKTGHARGKIVVNIAA
jgi:NADPH:quinone reductase-like Zn-dependent oxidoreductase